MRQRGFTILEVAIAITLAVFILMSAMPSISSWMRSTRMRTTAESISNGLMQARNEAVRRNQPVSFYLVSSASGDVVSMADCALSASGSGWVIGQTAPAANCSSAPGSFIALRPPGDSGAGLSVSANGTTVTFNGYGQVSNAGAINCIKFSNAADSTVRTLAIGVQSGGQVRMCDAKVQDADDPRYCLDPAVKDTGCP